jgi:ubiquinone/menaquinone biosynthesis C-methylase UbiE
MLSCCPPASRLAAFDVGRPGQYVVDVDTGTGTVARGFALRGCLVIGIDPSPELLDQARRLDIESEVTADYSEATAEATGLPDASVEVVSAGQCWYWFDRPAAADEARRVLRLARAIVRRNFDWLALPGSVGEAGSAPALA